MAMNPLYKAALLDHYRNPRNRGDPSDAQVVRRGRNPQCGDDVEIGVDFDGEILRRVRFRGRGCSICIASASIMTEATSGRSRDQAWRIADFVQRWFGKGPVEDAPPDLLQPLSPVRDIPARRRCVLLAWEALESALSGEPER
jgi:nitrogen fixation NifU-like protein